MGREGAEVARDAVRDEDGEVSADGGVPRDRAGTGLVA